jgi:hypothetical protein
MSRLILVAIAAVALGASIAVASQPAAVDDPISTGLDVVTTGNTATSLGPLETCREVGAGEAFDVDMFVLDVPPPADGKGGVMGFSYNLLFDPSVLEVTAIDDNFLTQAGGDTTEFESIDADYVQGENPDEDPLPGTTGDVRVDYFDFGDAPDSIESGSGVLSRITLHAVGTGLSGLQLVDEPFDADEPMIISSAALEESGQGRYPIASVQNAIIAVADSCAPQPSVTPVTSTPTPTPVDGTITPSASPTEEPTDTPEPTESAVPSVTPTQTAGGGQVWGNGDCDEGISTRDNQALLRQVLQQTALSQTEPCPDLGELFGDELWGDWDCDGEITTRDNQALLRNVLQQTALSQTEPCTDIGTVHTVS